MPINLSKFKNVDKRDGVAVYQREVDTPMPETEDGGGYTTGGNIQTAYRVGHHIVKVSKVSDNGWSVWRYVEASDGGGPTIGEQYGSGLNAQEAQRLARIQANKLSE